MNTEIESGPTPPFLVLDSSSGQAWYVVHSKPRQVQVALENLLRQGWHAWLPQIKVATIGKRSARKADKLALEPMFVRYLFIRPAHEEQSIAPVRSTLGVSMLVRFGVQLATIDHQTVCDLAHLELAQRQLDYHQITPLQPGVAVQIVSGPLAGLKGLVSMASSERVVVLLDLLGRQQEIRLRPAQLALAS